MPVINTKSSNHKKLINTTSAPIRIELARFTILSRLKKSVKKEKLILQMTAWFLISSDGFCPPPPPCISIYQRNIIHHYTEWRGGSFTPATREMELTRTTGFICYYTRVGEVIVSHPPRGWWSWAELSVSSITSRVRNINFICYCQNWGGVKNYY